MPAVRTGQPISVYGAVMVSTGIVRLDKRAEVSDLFKQGNFFKLTDNDNFVLAAA